MIEKPRFWNPVLQKEPQLTEREKKLYTKLVLAARDSKAFPGQSGFHVRAALMTAAGDIELGGNAEFAFSDGFVHGETSALAASLEKHGNVPIEALAFYRLSPIPEEPAKSCGNCRDVFVEYVNPDMKVLKGDEDFISIIRFGDLLFENFSKVDIGEITPVGIVEAEYAIKSAVDTYLPDHLKHAVYGVSIVSQNEKVWRGSLDTNAGYDATTPGVAVKQVWRNTNPEPELQKIVFASYEALPKPLYRDRQTLRELDEALMDYTGRQTPLRVELVSLDRLGRIVQAAVTNTIDWMPFAFTAGSFGMTEAVRGSLKGLFSKNP